MRKTFWQKLNTPIYALAPMAGVTDSAFRQICKNFGVDVVYSELASATALNYAPAKTLELLKFVPAERPYVVQLFGSNPKHFAVAAKMATQKLKPDGIDINFGCPVKKVQKQGAGAILMSDLKLSHEVIKSVIDNTHLPVSIKIRARVEKDDGATKKKVDALIFLEKMKDLPIAAVMIHGRSLAQGHKGEVDWQIIKEAKKIFPGILLANGGVNDWQTAEALLEKTGADGLGIARGAMGRPWIFEEVRSKNAEVKSKKEIFKIALKHAKLAEKMGGRAGIVELRKHLCWYVTGLEGASELRQELVKVESYRDIKKILSGK
ncbi:MAG: tRNA-dihydrouridine synthase [Parcubacteria group bacterium GW2011_GWE2_39_37]|nr:MAG: tRNA-dihydrouridine synthase [Parcubacteria group bacterium GW2011_GWE2_39_37]